MRHRRAPCFSSPAQAAPIALAVAAAELTVVFGLIVLVTGPLWARKAWGVWWQWDARLTSALVLWLIFSCVPAAAPVRRARLGRLAAAVALFGMANVPFVYWSVNVWRTLHPKTTVVPSLPPGMRGPFWLCVRGFPAALRAAARGADAAREAPRASSTRSISLSRTDAMSDQRLAIA